MSCDSKRRIGAALSIGKLKDYRDWLLDGQRDLEIQDPAVPAVLDGDWKPSIRQAKEALSGYKGRLGIHGPFIGFNYFAGFDKQLRDIVAMRLRKALEFASELGATHMVIHSPYMNFGASPFAINAGPQGAFEEDACIHSILDEIAGLAERMGCVLVIENIEDTNPHPVRNLVRSFNSDYVRMSIDVGHAFITHQRGGPTPDQWVREAGPLLAHMHIQDSDGQTDRHWAPGEGNINWHALFEALESLQQTPRMVLELRDYSRVGAGAAYLASRGFVE